MFIILRVVSDIFFVFLSYLFAYFLRFNLFAASGLTDFHLLQHINYLLFVFFVYVVSFYFIGMYKVRKGFLLYIDELLGCFLGVTLAWAFLIVITFLLGEYGFSRPIILLSWPISFFLLLISREIILRIDILARSAGFGSKHAAVIGTDAFAHELAGRIKSHPSYGISFKGFVGGSGPNYLGNIDELEEIVIKNKIDVIYVADKNYDHSRLVELADFCDQKGIVLGTTADVFEILTVYPTVDDIDGLPMIKFKQTRFTLLNRSIKRFFDITLAFLGIIIFSVPMFVIMLAIKFSSPGDGAVYKQERVGREGKIFNLYKFRTMVPNAEEETGPVLAAANDPRKTTIGKILRATNLDELPQLFNILKGDMSFVGPRPERPVFVNEYKEMIPKYVERHRIRPGLAGWAQLHGGYHMPAEEKIRYDLYYIENWSFLLDIKILIKYLQISFSFQREN